MKTLFGKKSDRNSKSSALPIQQLTITTPDLHPLVCTTRAESHVLLAARDRVNVTSVALLREKQRHSVNRDKYET